MKTVAFKKGHSHTAWHAHAMLYAQRSKSLSKNYSTHADAFFTDECTFPAVSRNAHARKWIEIQRANFTVIQEEFREGHFKKKSKVKFVHDQ
jgi:hypothetical protein